MRQQVESIHGHACKASGRLSMMIAKGRFNRTEAKDALQSLRKAAEELDALLSKLEQQR